MSAYRWVGAALLAALVACAPKSTPVASPAASAEPAVIKTREFTAGGKTYTIETIPDEREDELRTTRRDVRAPASGDAFAGKVRKAAKISIARAPVESFDDLKDLIATLPSRDAMVNHKPKIKTTATSNRVAEEKRNVRVKAFLYAASREDDNDYHLIIGRAPDAAPKMFFTVEVSGLPPSSSTAFARLKSARESFKTFFGADLPGEAYDRYPTPFAAEVEGSLFFDIGHASGIKPGPKALSKDMPVVWEIHPVTRIAFQP